MGSPPHAGAHHPWLARLDVIGAALARTGGALNEALTNLYVGLHRELRGERLVASRFIQVFAVDPVMTAAVQQLLDTLSARTDGDQ